MLKINDICYNTNNITFLVILTDKHVETIIQSQNNLPCHINRKKFKMTVKVIKIRPAIIYIIITD